MKLLFSLFLGLCVNLLAVNHPPKLPIGKALPLLQNIESYALHIGKGNSDIYVFVDPLCPHSRDFMDLIVNSTKMQERYTYHIFLYHLAKFDSSQLIKDIYRCSDELECLKEVMINKHDIKENRVKNNTTNRKIVLIETVAKTLNVYKRPYLIINKAKKREK